MTSPIKIQKYLLGLALLQFCLKIIAWYFTNSVAILTDALESIVNIIGSLAGWMALSVAAKPKDRNHPYGHGKIEFLSASFEGILIGATAIIIIYESIKGFYEPHLVKKLDVGLILIAISGLINYFVGRSTVKKGESFSSLQLISTGKHLLSDAYSTFGLFIGILMIFVTQNPIIDRIVAIIFATMLLYTAFKILKESIAGILDEADDELLQNVINYLQENRKENWIDLHNLRIIKYGSTLHFDCHLTLPWYYNVHEAHKENEDLHLMVKEKFGESVELFSHTDGCLPYSCQICLLKDCKVRQLDFVKKIEWTPTNVRDNSKHKI